MKRAKTVIFCASVLALMAAFVIAPTCQAEKKETREVVISQIKGNVVYYYKATKASNYIANAKKGNKVGSGKRKQIKVTGKTKYYFRNAKKKKVRASKNSFARGIGGCQRHISGSRIYYTGNYCKMKLVGGKCTKITQEKQK